MPATTAIFKDFATGHQHTMTATNATDDSTGVYGPMVMFPRVIEGCSFPVTVKYNDGNFAHERTYDLAAGEGRAFLSYYATVFVEHDDPVIVRAGQQLAFLIERATPSAWEPAGVDADGFPRERFVGGMDNTEYEARKAGTALLVKVADALLDKLRLDPSPEGVKALAVFREARDTLAVPWA